MKRILSRMGLCLVLAALIVLAAGCSEKYYNGAVSILDVTDTERAKLRDASEEVAKVLQIGTRENLLGLLPDEHTEEQAQAVSDGWDKWEEICAQYGEVTGYETKEIFLYHYMGAVMSEYSFGDTVICADMFYTSNFNLVYLDFYKSAKSAEAEYSLPEGLTEREVIVGEGTGYELGGTLTYPTDGTDLPVVVLIHGVGNNTRDEDALNTKMFRDLANGLAKQGIAVLRYDKRTFAYPEAQTLTDVSTLTIDFIAVEDAVRAVELARGLEMADPDRIWLAGHDLGALILPRIDEQADTAGFVLMNTTSRKWSDVAYDQLMRYGMNGMETDNVRYLKPLISGEYKSVQDIEKLDEEELSTVMLSQYGYFWKDLNSRDYPAEYAASGKPVLVMQGGADYQILPDPDFNGWKEILAGKANAQCKLYDGLNHMMMTVEGPYTDVTKQYQRPLKVDGQVISDIAAFVNAGTGK